MHSFFLPLLVLCFALRLTTTTTNADDLRFHVFSDCRGNTNYSRRGAFQANLDAVISSLPAATAASSGFAQNATGAAPDRAYGLAQCRGDVGAPECRSCHDDEGCLLRYSNASFFGVPGTSDPVPVYEQNDTNVTRPEQFMSRLGALMSDLTGKAAYGSPRMFAAGAVNHTRFVTIYGMAQCTRDTAADDCSLCLALAVKTIPIWCDGKEGGQIFVT